MSTHTFRYRVDAPFACGEEITLDQDDYLSQYLLHTQHHRAQIMSALRVMGKEAVTTDYLFYLSDKVK